MTPSQFPFQRQSGAILMVSLVMLFVLTVAGIATLSTTVRQERMALSNREGQLAIQNAEIALRDGEIWINSQASLPEDLTCVSTTPCRGEGFPGVFVLAAAEPRFATPTQLIALTLDEWKTDAETLQNAQMQDNVANHENKARYFVREARIIRDSLTLGHGDETQRYLYEVTALGVGQQDLRQRVLQSTFIRRY